MKLYRWTRKNTCVCDCAWIYQFSYCDSCANDEYSGINRRPDGFKRSETGMTAVVDGFSGQVIFEPEEDVRKETEKRMQEEAENRSFLRS